MSRSDETEFTPLSAVGLPGQLSNEAAEEEVRKKEGWPDFPFFWMKKPKMSSLQIIASHLKGKMETYRCSGVTGETTPAEKQIINLFAAQQQQVLEIHDAVQAALQILDDNRSSQRLKRAFKWIRRTASKYWHAMEQNILYRILGAVGVMITLWFVGNFVIHHFHLFGE